MKETTRKGRNEKKKIGCWNVGGLKKKTLDREIIEYLKTFHVIGLLETWVFGDNGVEIQGFKSIAKQSFKKGFRGRKAGGLNVLIKESKEIKYEVIKNLLRETIWLKVNLGGEKLLLCFAYVQPENSVYFRKGIMKEIELEANKINRENSEYSILMLGDFNARTGRKTGEIVDEWNDFNLEVNSFLCERQSKDKIINKHGKDLLELCNNEDLFILNGRVKGDEKGELTCITSIGNSVVDYGIASRTLLDFIDEFVVDNKGDSDHMPIVVVLSVENEEGTNEKERNKRMDEFSLRISKFRWMDTKEEEFNKKIEEEYSLIYTIGIKETIKDGMINRANEMLYEWIKFVCGKMEVKEKKRYTKKNGWFDSECQERKSEVNRKLRVFRRSGDEIDLKAFKDSKKEFRKLCEKKQEEYNITLKEKINSIIAEKNSKELWKVIGVKRKEKSKNNIPGSEWVRYLAQLFSSEEENEEEIEINNEFKSEKLDCDITRQEVLNTVKDMKSGKAPGIDGVGADIFKQLMKKSEICDLITVFFNKMFETGTVPKNWGEGIITMLYKGKGDKQDTDNYRGITLLNVVSKIFTRILAERIQNWAEETDKLIPHQAGFRKGFSTVDNLYVMNIIVDRQFQREGRLYVCFIDFKKAFDCIERKLLWKKLYNLSVSAKIVKVLKSLYKNVTVRMKVNEWEVSESINIKKGVRQGCQLSPLLFTLFLNDLNEWFSETEMHAPWLNDTEIKFLLYADDMVLMSQSGVGLQRGLDKLREYCIKWKLEVNTKKTKVMVFRKSTKSKIGMNWWYNREKLEIVKEFIYLGVLVQENLKWKNHQEHVVRKANRVIGLMRKWVYRMNNFPVDVLIRMFDCMVTPVLGYGVEIWGGSMNKELLNKVQIKWYKEVLGVGQSSVNAAVLNEIGHVTVSDELEKRWLCYAWKLKHMKNRRMFQYVCLNHNVKGKPTKWKESINAKIAELKILKVWTETGNISLKQVKNTIAEEILKERKKDVYNEINKKKGASVLC